MEATFLQALHAEPTDELTWLALADWLEEDGQSDRAELVRLVRRLRTLPPWERSGDRAWMEARVAELLDAGVRPVVAELINSIGMRLTLISAGRFLMGSPEDEQASYEDERPQHEVEITRAFYLGVFPVTQAQWQKVMGNNPSYSSATGGNKDRVAGLDTGDFPVEQVSWEEAQAFLKRLSELPQEKNTARRNRLPGEAEWEYACRGGHGSDPFHCGRSLCSAQANFDGRHPYGSAAGGPCLERSCRVGSYPPNAFGLYDMHGNVWEWCSDWYEKDYYKSSPRRDPTGPFGGSFRVIRGGGWDYDARSCRSACRSRGAPDSCNRYLGFRVASDCPLNGARP
jgi:uncharacterized protein (TIGR02996 family)